MPTLHAEHSSALFARAIAAAMTADAKDLGLGRKKIDVRPPTGAPDELVIVVGKRADTRKGRSFNQHCFAITLEVTRNNVKRRLRATSRLWSGRVPDETYRSEALARAAARMLAPYFTRPKTPAKKRTVHVDAYYAQSAHSFRLYIVRKLAEQGYRTRLTLGLDGPDPSCWGYLQLPFVRVYNRDGKVALSPLVATAGGHTGKTTIRATLAPDVSEASATRALADKLLAWYGKLAQVATE